MFEDRLSPLDASFLQLEDETAHMHVAGVQVFEGEAPAYDDVLELIGSRLDQVPRYRQKVVFPPLGIARPRWVDDPHFNLGYHIRHTALPSPGSEEQLRTLAGRVFAQPLSRDRPLWEMWLVEGLDEGRFAVLTKTHHAMVDGIASVDILSLLLDAEPEPDREPAQAGDWHARPAPGRVRLAAEGLVERTMLPEVASTAGALARTPQRMAREALRVAAGVGSVTWASATTPAPSSPYNTRIGPHRRFTWQREALGDLKAIKDALGGSVNDIVLTAVAGALRRHLQRRGENVAGMQLRAFVPVSVRTEEAGGQGGNEVSGFQAPLPVGERDPLERYRTIHFAMEQLKDSGQALGAKLLTDLTGFAPPNVLSQASRIGAFQRYFNVVVTNVPGPQQPLYMLGHRLLDIVPLVPLGQNTALGIAIISYDGGMTFGFSGDDVAMEDIEALTTDLHDALAELAQAVEVELSGPAAPKASGGSKASRSTRGGSGSSKSAKPSPSARRQGGKVADGAQAKGGGGARARAKA